MKCKRCDVEMKEGVAIWPWNLYGVFYTLSFFYADYIKKCWKCPKCGESYES